jgi:glycosyltransferase involved in cell wall biosynthesis
MKDRGHYIIHYGHEDSEVYCDELVTVVTKKDFDEVYGNNDYINNFFKYDTTDNVYSTFYKNSIQQISLRKQKHDFILPFWGVGVKPICDAHPDLICVEPGIGYATGHWARWKIFESYAIYHAYYGLNSVGTCKQDWYETVIPNYFDPQDFDFCKDKDDYFLFIGRVYNGKGVNIAIEVTKKLGYKLIIAGQGNLKDCGYEIVPDHVTVIGYADKDTRKKLMSKAKAGFVASMYLEPFGGVQIEMLMSGTPTITTDWGSFTENNIHGVTGYRCRTFDQFCWAAKNIHKIKPEDCRNWAMNFSIDKVGLMYEDYFHQVLDVYQGNGWYEPFTGRPSLKSLERHINNETTLGDIFLKNKTDKLSRHPNGHNYNIKYQELFDDIRHKPIKLFEMGIGSINPDIKSSMVTYKQLGYNPGSSHRSWKEYFDHPQTQIFGGDIDADICDEKQFFHVDQTNKNDLNTLFTKLQIDTDDKFDIIIDDGLHTQNASKTMFNQCYKYVKPGGYYIIEDIKIDWTEDHPELEFWSHIKNCGEIQDNYLCIFKKNLENREYLLQDIETKLTSIEVHKPKIAIWGSTTLAMGKIYNDLIQYMSKWYDLRLYNWNIISDNYKLFVDKDWKNYDIILGTTTTPSELIKIFDDGILDQQLLNKMLLISHCPIFNNESFMEKITVLKGPTYCGISQEVVNNMEREYEVKSNLLPIGINSDNFYPIRVVKSILKIGFIGNPNCGISEWCSIKRPDMFTDICNKSGVEPVYIFGKHYTLFSKLYDDVDMLICTSVLEGAGQGIIEAGACNIPVISTKVGYAQYLSNIKTFEKVEEAVDIIKYYQNHSDELIECSTRLGDEIRRDWNCDLICKKYWKPVIDEKLKGNKINYDFIEIGTSDFDYNSDITKKGLLFEPVKEYYDRLICGPNTIKTRCAITHEKKTNSCNIYYIPSDIIIKQNLPQWIRGCNCIDKYHPQHLNYKKFVTIENIKLIDVSEIYDIFNIGYVEYIKIDTEGHDCVIMEGFYNYYKNIDTKFYPKTIKFESNELSNKKDVIDITEKFKLIGYYANIGYDTILTLK